MKNVCVVGYGAIGPIHASALAGMTNARFYGICDISAQKRALCLKKYAEKGMILKEYDDFDKMLQDENIHCIHICTPHYLHFEMIKKALAAGKDVVTEKPVTRTKEEYEQLLVMDGAEKVCVVLQNRLNPGIVKFKEIIESGELGAVKSVRALLTWHRDRAYYENSDWRGRWDTEGGGLLINQAIHTLDYFRYLIGDIVSVKANMSTYSLEDIIQVEDTLSAYLEFANGVKGIFFATNAYAQNSSPLFEVAFEKGIVRYEDLKLIMNGQVLAEDVAATEGKAYWGSGHAGLFKRFYEDQQYFNVYDVKNTMETVFAIYESAHENGKKKSVLQNRDSVL